MEVDFLASSPSDRARIKNQLYLGEPIHERYGHFVWRLVKDQSTGQSGTGRDSGEIALEAVPATAALVIPGLILGLLVGWAAAVPWSRAGARRRHLWRFPGYIAVGLLPMWLGLWLSYGVAFKWGWLPTGGYCDFFDPLGQQCGGGGVAWAEHLVLPWIVFALFFGAIYARVLRVVLTDVKVPAEEDRRRLARRARLVVARLTGRDVGFAIGAAALVEVTFGVPGLGRYVVAGSESDLRVAEAAVLYAAFVAIAVHFLVDVAVGALDSDLRAEWPVAGMPART